MRRSLSGAAAAAVVAVAVAVPAQAAHTQALVFGATLLDQPKGQPWAVSLNLDATLGTDDGSLAAPLHHVRFQFPAGAKINADQFPTCSATTVAQSLRCPKGSLLGTGLVKVDARPLLTSVDVDLKLYNGKGNSRKRTLLLTATTSAIEINLVIPGSLTRAGGRYSYTFDADIPEVRAVPGAPPVAITGINIDLGGRIKKHGRKISYIDAPTKCPSGGWPFTGTFTFGDGVLPTLDSHLDCTLRTVSG